MCAGGEGAGEGGEIRGWWMRFLTALLCSLEQVRMCGGAYVSHIRTIPTHTRGVRMCGVGMCGVGWGESW